MQTTAEKQASERFMRQVRAYFALHGSSYSDWARARGYSPQMASYAILRPARRGVLAARIRAELYRLLGNKVNQ